MLRGQPAGNRAATARHANSLGFRRPATTWQRAGTPAFERQFRKQGKAIHRLAFEQPVRPSGEATRSLAGERAGGGAGAACHDVLA